MSKTKKTEYPKVTNLFVTPMDLLDSIKKRNEECPIETMIAVLENKEGELITFSSNMKHKDALWLIEMLKLDFIGSLVSREIE